MHFDAIGRVPGDPILGLMDLYAQDANPNKFDLGVGVYKDDQGLTPIPHSVKLAEQRLVETRDQDLYWWPWRCSLRQPDQRTGARR